MVDASGGAISVFLPASLSVRGMEIDIKKIDNSGNAVTIVPNGAETVDGESSLLINSQYGCFTLIANDNDWVIV
jgi:hypothetical protein